MSTAFTGGSGVQVSAHSAGTTRDLGKAINAISASPDGTSYAVVGRDILKIMSLRETENGDLEWNLAKNLRVGRTNLTFSSVDVQWNPHSEKKHLIATAATNKSVIVWNLLCGQKTQQERVFTEHSRTVNSLCWSPYSSDLFLSGSQDGTVKLWDLREPTSTHVTFRVPRSDSVRDVKYSPFYRNYFASAYDGGSIQVWDLRQPSRGPLQQLSSAHNGLIMALDWHPTDKNVLASGGRDRFIKMWNLKKSPSSPVKQIQTTGSVARVKWRPECDSHITCSYSIMDPALHVWDLDSPNIPIYVMSHSKDVVTGVTWVQNSPDWVTLASKDGSLGLYRMPEDARIPYHEVVNSAISWSAMSGISVVNEVIDRHYYDPHSVKARHAALERRQAAQRNSTSFSLFPFAQASTDTATAMVQQQENQHCGSPL